MPTLSTNAWLRFDEIRRALGIAQPRTVLEMGAGEGGLGAWLAGSYEYTGIEPDTESRAMAQSRLAPVGRGRVVAALDNSPIIPASTSCARSRCSSTSPTTSPRSRNGANTSCPTVGFS